MNTPQFIPTCYTKKILILGCGNVLFGDDGFGPEVANRLQASGSLPPDVEALDVGTGVRDILFTLLLAEQKPRLIILVDCADTGDSPGTLRHLSIDEIPVNKRADLSLHQVPTGNLLRELHTECGVEVTILVVQPEFVPKEVQPGLSQVVSEAVERACQAIMDVIRNRE